MAAKDAVIKKIVLQLGGKEVSLTPDEAKKLFEALGEMFEKKVVHVYEPHRWYWGSSPVYAYGSYTHTPIVNGDTWLASNGTSFALTNSTLTCSVS